MAKLERNRAAAGRIRDSRIIDENSESRKQEIARRLKLSERVLEQYFQSKQAEVEDELDLSGVAARNEPRGVQEKRI